MGKFYYWRRGRAHNADTLHFVFANREDGYDISAYVKPTNDNMWIYCVEKPFNTSKGTTGTQEEAQAKVEKLIAYEFRPEYMPYFG